MEFISLYFLLACSFIFGAPQAVYLTLAEDPSHSMSIHWIEKGKKEACNALFYQKKGDKTWKKVFFTSHQALNKTTYSVKESLLVDLEEASSYVFYFEKDNTKYSFRTLPSQIKTPLKIIVGGDFAESLAAYFRMNAVAAGRNLDFVVLGGDLAYAVGAGFSKGKHGSIKRWVSFFEKWHKTMRGEDGRLIPVVAIVGNHDVTSTDRKEKGVNSYFLKFFPSENGYTYKKLEIGGILSLFLLDTAHIFPIAKDQEIWLEKALKESSSRWKIPVYHVAAYPSFYSLKANVPTEIRNCWVPLFETYGVRLAFEHHNHVFKRTYPLLKEKIDPKGIVYIGDGAWGVIPRNSSASKNKEAFFYLDKQENSTCFSLLTVNTDSLKVESFDNKNNIMDSWTVADSSSKCTK